MVVAYERPYNEPYEKMFFLVEKAMIENDFEITAKNFSKGKLLASKGIRASFLKNRWGTVIYVKMRRTKKSVFVSMESKTIFWDSNVDVIPLFITLDKKLYYSSNVVIEPFSRTMTSQKFVVKNPNAQCPKCDYQYTSMSTIDSPTQESALSICPRCHHEYNYVISQAQKPKIERFTYVSDGNEKHRKYLEVVTTRPVIYGSFLIFLTLIYFLIFLGELFMMIFVGIPLIYLFLGTILISKRKFKWGCILTGSAGALLMPIGALGLFAADLAWKYYKWSI